MTEPKDAKPPMPEWPGMPPMMRQMMQGMGEGMRDFNPMAMCQAMMTSVSKSAEMAAYATPEVRTLFNDCQRLLAAPTRYGLTNAGLNVAWSANVPVGVVNVKDFVAFGRGISLSIPEPAKHGLTNV